MRFLPATPHDGLFSPAAFLVFLATTTWAGIVATYSGVMVSVGRSVGGLWSARGRAEFGKRVEALFFQGGVSAPEFIHLPLPLSPKLLSFLPPLSPLIGFRQINAQDVGGRKQFLLKLTANRKRNRARIISRCSCVSGNDTSPAASMPAPSLPDTSASGFPRPNVRPWPGDEHAGVLT